MKSIQFNLKRNAALVVFASLTALSGLAIAATAADVTSAGEKQAKHTVMAEHRHGMHKDGAKRGHHAKRGGHHRGFKSMLRGLDLTEEQRDKVFEIRHASKPAMRAAHKQMRAARKGLRELALSGNVSSEQLQQQTDMLGQAAAALAVIRTQSLSDVIAVLTPAQATQLRERMAKHGERGHGAGHRKHGKHHS